MPNTPMVSTTMSVTPPSLVVARLESPCLPRTWAGTLLGCEATNNNISNPVRSNIGLDMLGKYHSIYRKRRGIIGVKNVAIITMLNFLPILFKV